MSYSLCQLFTNVDGYLLGHSEIDYRRLPAHLIPRGEFLLPYYLLVTFTHQALLRDYGRGALISEFEVYQYWADAKNELSRSGSADEDIKSLHAA
jgi:hypothetical protein